MIWIFVVAVALLLVFVWALMRTASLADRDMERMFREKQRHGWGPYEETHVRVLPTPYDWERRGDFE